MGGSNFVNPPYGRELPKWIKKGFEEWQKGKTVVFLIPSRTDTRWWHEYCMKATEIRFIKGGEGMTKYFKFIKLNPGQFPYVVIKGYIGPMHDPNLQEVSEGEYRDFLREVVKRGYLFEPGDQDMSKFRLIYDI